MLNFLKKACLAVACALVAMFAANNRGPVFIDLWPFGLGVEMPLYLFALIAIFLGILMGAMLKNTKEQS
jgi:uncharacterized integral membrane protein